MSKTVRKLGGLALVGMGIFVGIISFGVASAAAFKLVIAGAALYSSAKKPKLPGLSPSFGTEVQLSGDPNAVRQIVYGEKWVGGDLRFRRAVGTDDKELYMVIVLAGHEIDSVTAVEADRELLTLDGSGNVTSPAKWVGLINIRFYSGTDSQTADATLVSVMGGGPWTTNHRLRGLAYAIVHMTFDESFLSTPPALRFLVKGRKVYDARLDSTNGGSGSHRLATPSTWQWSRNTVLCQNDYDRGIYINGKRIAGRGIATSRFDWANVIAEANVCDEDVDLDAGGDEPRYTCDGIIDPSVVHGDNIRMFEGAYAGDSLPSDGKWRYFTGAYRTPTLHLQDGHFIGPLRHLVHKGASSRFDAVQGVYASMAESGTAVPYSPVVLPSATTGEEAFFDLDLQLVSDVTNTPGTFDGGARAQRIAKLILQREVAGKSIQCTTSLYGYRAVAGETILITRSSFGLSSQAMRVLDVQLRPVEIDGKIGLVTDLTLEAGPSDLYEWDAEETAIAASPELLQAQVPFPTPVDGVDGTDGADGADGADGTDGAPGDDGKGGVVFEDTFEYANSTEFLDEWEVIPSGGAGTITFPANGDYGGKVLQVAGGTGYYMSKKLVPYDTVTQPIYSLAARYRQTVAPTNAQDFFYAGFAGVAADGVTLINISGANSAGSQHYVTASGRDLGNAGINTWTATQGYVKGLGSPISGEALSIGSPDVMKTGVRYLRAIVYMNYSAGDGTQQLDYVRVTRHVDLAHEIFGQLTTAFAAAGLINTNVSINADGSLTGAGGGAPVISSLTGSVAIGQLTANVLAALQAVIGNLAAINANIGHITAGDITLTATGYLRAPAIAYDGNGLFAGYDAGEAAFSVRQGSRFFRFKPSVGYPEFSGSVSLFNTPSSFTPTYNAADWSVDPTGPVYYVDHGNYVILWHDPAGSVGTSSGADCRWDAGSLPSGIRPPSGEARSGLIHCYNNGSPFVSAMYMQDDGSVIFYPLTAAWSSSGAKGIVPGATILWFK